MEKELPPQLKPFRLHDQEGIPLTFQIAATKEQNLPLPNLLCFFFASTWTPEKTIRTIKEACADNSIHFDETEFSTRAKVVFTAFGSKPFNETYLALCDHLLSRV